MWPTIRDCPALDDGRLGPRTGGLCPGPDPLCHPCEDVAEVKVNRGRSRHGHRLRPPIREFPFENSQGKFGPNVDLAREGCDHPGFEIGLGLPNEALKGPIRFAFPSHPVAERLGGDSGQLGRSFSIAPAADRMEDDGGTVIGQFRFPATTPTLPR
jgi:hypothetical protein